MRIRALTCAIVVAAVPASAQEGTVGIKLLMGHPVYHEGEREAGVAMALSITPNHDRATSLVGVCEELRTAAGLKTENGDDLRLETIFVVPYKGMAVEGYYWPNDGTLEEGTLVRGNAVPRGTLDRILARAGIPPQILDEAKVEHEISCETAAPLWHVNWSDVRLIGDEDPDTVIERAYQRFMAIHQAVVAHNIKGRHPQTAQRQIADG